MAFARRILMNQGLPAKRLECKGAIRLNTTLAPSKAEFPREKARITTHW